MIKLLFTQKGYIDLLSRFQEDMREPFNKFMAYKDTTTKELKDICGHYVESKHTTLYLSVHFNMYPNLSNEFSQTDV